MQFGFFDDTNKEYVITSPKTPYPWINYLGTEAFFSLISNTAGGYSFYKDARLRRITRYRYNNVPIDMGGRYFYINDNGTVWNPGWAPVKTELDSYECRHGMGYTNITGKKNDLKASVLFFVPNDFNGEVQKVTLTNESNSEKTFKLFSFTEWCLWNAQDDSTNFQRNFSTGEVEIVKNNGASVLVHKTEYKERRNHFAFYSVNADVQGFDTSRDEFLGLYNGFENPQTVLEGKPNNSVANGWAPIASHYIEVTLGAGETKEFVFVLGYVENEQDDKFTDDGTRCIAESYVKMPLCNKTKAYEMIEKFNTAEKVNQAFDENKKRWDELLSIYQVNTPDEKMNRMVNIWNQYQDMVTFNMSRSASYFESGIGRGMGFRDSNQDLLGFVHQVPERARERILDLAATQLEDGGCYHQYQPLTKKGNDEVGGNFSDDPLWMILSTAAYIKETGDYSILKEQVPYDNNVEKAQSMFHHLKQSFWKVANNLGPHKLPLIGRADWNDCLNLNCFSNEPGESFQTTTSKDGKVAESIFVAGLFTYVAPEYVAICKYLGEKAEEAKALDAIEKMGEAIIQDGYDNNGDEGWYLRAYDDFGKKVGASECEEGKIFIEPQGFCVMSEIGKSQGYDIKALDAVDKYLNCKHGIVLNNPAFTAYKIEYGEISTYPGGYKENAGVFCHNNSWIMCAEAYVGRGDKAYEYYSKIAPAYLEDVSELHKTEPYVYAQMIAGKDANRAGEAKNSWLTGTAAWNFVAVSQYILGIFPDWAGLKLDPCIPKEWDGFTVSRKYRGATYEITFKNPNHVYKGVKSVTVDGAAIEGNIVTANEKGKTYQVEVTLG